MLCGWAAIRMVSHIILRLLLAFQPSDWAMFARLPRTVRAIIGVVPTTGESWFTVPLRAISAVMAWPRRVWAAMLSSVVPSIRTVLYGLAASMVGLRIIRMALLRRIGSAMAAD